MKRRSFLTLSGGAILLASTGYYLWSDKKNLVRNDIDLKETEKISLKPDENEILYLASLAPSGHNTQPWFIKYIEPYHWIIGNDSKRWLPNIDPNQRETILSIGAFLQNLEFASSNLGYDCQFTLLATHNQNENIMEVRLIKGLRKFNFDPQKIIKRCTVRSNFSSERIQEADLNFLRREDSENLHFIPNNDPNYQFLNNQTIEANRIQSYRDSAELELSNWIRFSNKEANAHLDGLTTAGMEIDGISGWIVRNFYSKQTVMEKGFREKSISHVIQQVSQSAGWMLITSKGNSVATLLETGKIMQRLFLKIRDKGIAMHPMTQILEETATNQTINHSIGIKDPIQFILRMSYLKSYPEPVSLRRPLDALFHS